MVVFDKPGCGAEKLVDNVHRCDLWNVFSGVPFLVAFVGVILIDFYLLLKSLLIPDIIHEMCGVISFPGVYKFLLSVRDCYHGVPL